MKALFLLQAPLQILSTYEAICEFKIKKPYLIIRYSGNHDNDFQMSLLLKLLGLDEYVIYRQVITYKSTKDIRYFYQVARFLRFFLSIYYNINDFDFIFVPEYYSGFVRLLDKLFLSKIRDKSSIFLLDDGVATIYMQEKMFSDNLYRNLFTFFDKIRPYNSQVIKVHTFSNLRKLILKDRNIKKSEETIFLGQDFYESSIMSIEDNIKLIKMAMEKLGLNAKKVVYIPHRKESEEKLEQIRKTLSFKVKKIFYPVELLPYFDCKMPNKLVSFVSTALITLNIIYNKFPMHIYAVRFPLESIAGRRKESFYLTYNMLEKYNIKIVSL